MQTPIVIYGAGELAELAHFYFTHDSNYKVEAFSVAAQFHKSSTFCNLPLITEEDLISEYPAGRYKIFIAIGSSRLNQARKEVYLSFKNKGYQFATYISSRSVIWSRERIGENCFIMDMNNIHPLTSIGNNVIFSNCNHIGHHSIIEDHCFITSNVVVSGGVRIGDSSFLGVNSTIRDHVSVGKRNIIGAGALIMHDTDDDAVYKCKATEPRRCNSNRVKSI